MTGIRLSSYLERNRDFLERRLRNHPDVEAAAKELSRFFAGLSQNVTKPEQNASADIPALRLRDKQLREQLPEAIRSGFVGALRAIRPPVSRPSGPHGKGAAGAPYGAGQGDDRRIFGITLPILGRQDAPAEHAAPPAPAPVEVSVSLLLSSLAGALQAADQVLAAAEPLPPERVPIPWEEDHDLMELCQDLLRALITNDGQLALRHIARLRGWLPDQHGITVIETYDGSEEHFRIVPPSDPAITEPVTVRPALVLKDRPVVVLRGEVSLPDGFATMTPPTFSDATGAEADHE